MALIRGGDSDRRVKASIAECVFSLKQQLVVEPWFVDHQRRTARPQGADRKRIERLIGAANRGRHQDQIFSGEQIAQRRILIVGNRNRVSLTLEASSHFLVVIVGRRGGIADVGRIDNKENARCVGG